MLAAQAVAATGRTTGWQGCAMQTRCLSAQDEEFVQRLAPVWAQQGGPAHGMDERAARSMLADVVKQLRSSVTPGLAGDLQRAIIRGAAAVEQLLTSLAAEERAGLLAAPLPCGQLPLHFACSYGSPDAARALLDYGADINAPDPSDSLNSALHRAAARAHDGIIELLLSKGANPVQLNQEGLTPLEHGRDWNTGVTPRSGCNFALCERQLEAAAAAAPPELRRVRKAAAACGHCGKEEGLKKCGGCELAWFCSPECQKQAWPGHKQRCKAAKRVQGWLALLADTSQPAEQRYAAMCGLVSSPDAARLAGELHALKLLAPVVLEDSPVAAGGPAYNVTHIPSVRAAVAVAAVSSQQDHAVDGPVPPRVRQLCALRLPELLLQRLSKPDAPRADLGALLELLSDLSFALSGWVLSRRLLATGAAVRVLHLLCQLSAAQHCPMDALLFTNAAVVVGALVEAEQRAVQEDPEQMQVAAQRAPTVLDTLFQERNFLLRAVTDAAAPTDDGGGQINMALVMFVSSCLGSPLTHALSEPKMQAAVDRVSMWLFAAIPRHDLAHFAVAVHWFACVLEQRPGYFKQASGPFHEMGRTLGTLALQVVKQLAADLADGRMSSTREAFFMRVEQLPRKAAALLLALLRDLGGRAGSQCRAALSAQQLRAAAAAMERAGGVDQQEAAGLLRQAAALL